MNDRKVYAAHEVPQDVADAIENAFVKPNIKDIVKDNRVYFVFYRQQHMYYGVTVDDMKYIFPVPLEDIKDASMHADEKAITYMRYIRKALDAGTFVLDGKQ